MQRARLILCMSCIIRNLAQCPPLQSYYEKWAAALAAISIEMGTIKQSELEAALGLPVGTPQIE